MNVQFYSYKVEFQQRGAAHIHGIIWLNLDKLEKLVLIDGELCQSDDTKRIWVDNDDDDSRPLKGIANAFKKIRFNRKLTEDDIAVLVKFFDFFTTVSIHDRTVGKDVAKIAQEVNRHHHSKTCRKRGTRCRFNYPKPLSPYTIIAKPIEGKSPEAKKEILEKNHENINKVLDVLEDKDNLEKIMGQFDKQSEIPGDDHDDCKAERIQEACKMADVEYKDYVAALGQTEYGYSVVLSRDVDEMYINSYNAEWLRAWDANLDIQVVLDYFSVITYITDYYAKDDTGTMETIKKVMKDPRMNCQDLKERMKKLANTYLTCRQMGEAEAVYRLISSMNLSMSNIGCQFVALGPKEERSSRWRKATEAELNAGVPVEELENHEGLWYEQQDMWSKYLRRPASLDEMCFAQFAKMYKTKPKSSKKDDEDVDDQLAGEDRLANNIGDFVEDEEFDEEFDKFNYVMTYQNNGKRGVKLPNKIKIRDAMPGESELMQLRTRPVALRYHKVKEKNDALRYLFNEVMLYHPLQDELSEDDAVDLYEETYNDQRKVQIVKRQVMEYLDDVNLARHYVNEVHKEMEVSEAELMAEVGIEMDPQGELDNRECEETAEEEHPDYQHCFPDDDFIKRNGANEDTTEKRSIFRAVEMPSDEELRSSVQGLDVYQKEVINVAVKYCKNLVKSRCLENELPKPPLMMVHGGAGAGKSTVIKVLSSLSIKILQQPGDSVEQPYVLRTSYTGCASANIDGNTLHSALGFSFSSEYTPMGNKTRDQKRLAMKNLRILIIDEVSMLYSDMLYMLDLRLQEVKEKSGVPFGGVACFFFGDLMQLPPVRGKFISLKPKNQDYHVTYELDSRWHMFQCIVLEKNHRQGADKAYGDLLNKIRVGTQTDEDLEPLLDRVRPEGHPDLKKADLWISCTRTEVAARNKAYLPSLPGGTYIFAARHYQSSGESFDPQKYISKKDGAIGGTAFLNLVSVKVGCRVMLIHNIDVIDGLANGQFGELVAVVKTTQGKIDKLVIRPKDSKIGEENRKKFPKLAQLHPGCIFLERCVIQYSLTRDIKRVGSTATFVQFPIRLAACVTAHKMQGANIPYPTEVVMDLKSVFEPSQGYVMLSRVQRLEQIYILDNFDNKYLKVSENGLKERNRLDSISFNKNPTAWRTVSPRVVHIASLNCAGLNAHYEDILLDVKLLRADVLHLDETSVLQSIEAKYPIPNFNATFGSVGNGKGIVTYTKKVHMQETIVRPKFQITKTEVTDDLDSINVYRSSDGSIVDTLEVSTRIDVQIKSLYLFPFSGFEICH